MHKSLILLIQLCLIMESYCESELKFFQTVFRHGDRTPDDYTKRTPNFFPNNPYNESAWHPIPSGGLTNAGKGRSFELGKFFKRTYGEWLINKNPEIVKIFCSTSKRSEATGQLFAAGLFSPKPHERWNEKLNWQPIPITKVPIELGWLFHSTVGIYPDFEEALKKTETTNPKLIQYLKDNEKFYNYLSEHAGYNGTHALAYMVYVTLQSEYELGLMLPDWALPIFTNGKLAHEAGMEFAIRGFTDELRKYGGGLWLKLWLDNIDDFVAGKCPQRRAFIWSGHDQNVADVLVAIGAFNEPHIPPYASAIIVELHQIKQEYYVKILHKRNDVPEPLIVLGCETILCPLEKFRRQVAHLLPKDPAGMFKKGRLKGE